MKKNSTVAQIALLVLAFLALEMTALAATINTRRTTRTRSRHRITESARARRQMRSLRRSRTTYVRHGRRYRYARRHRSYERFYTSSFSDVLTDGDITAGEDPVVRAAAMDALGNMNGTVVAIDPLNGRVLTMVNQKLALSEGAQPCSTFKLAVALAALNEKIVDSDTELPFGRGRRRWSINMNRAIAISNNTYF
jgi:penicillin-binding protein 2